MKSIEEIKVKLQKLFAMMEDGCGASESEVQTAMVKARKLMAEYKLSKEDVLEVEKNLEVVQKQFSGITFSANVNPWICNLATLVAENYCCHAVMYHTFGAKTKTAGMIGFADDIELAGTVLRYAVNCALAEGTKIRRRATRQGYSNAEATNMINAYGNGWVRGIQEAFDKQNFEEQKAATSFAMVMVTPQEVDDYVKNNCQKKSFNTNKANFKARRYDSYAAEGYKAGKEFNMRTKLGTC